MKKEATSRRIRQDFFDFFAERDHKVVASAPIVPHDDPTLLFTNAGMNQFKDVFLGTGSRSYVRAADTQKCLRVSGKHNDLEEVGNDTYHHTFFEMLGNWSFGDYFKEEAIRWAWELLVDRWGLDPDRLYATVHAGDERLGLKPDDEAADLWKAETAIDPNHILLGSTKDNFWMMGETGPSGPCSEVHVDLRPDEDRARIPGASLVNKDHPEVIEIWNLVFIQYDAKKNGDLEPLTAKHVDTGMGLERVVAALDGSISTYDTDLFSPLLQKIADLTHVQGVKSYDDMDADAELRERLRIAMRVIADHVRAIAFAIADGVLPGNEGRGYVIRRILRRAVRYGYQVLDFRDPFMFELVAPLVEKMGDQFGDLVEKQTMIEDVIRAEEESFLRTLAAGITFFESLTPYVLGATAAGDSGEASIETNPKALDLLLKAYSAVDRDEAVRSFDATSKAGVLAGEIAFLLHDTYGFPVDLTRLMAREKELNVDMVRFDELMTGQRDRARAASQFKDIQVTPGSTQDDGEIAPTTFVGYNTLEYDGAEILSQTEVDGEGQKLHRLVLDTTPFYAESGGQLGDTGILTIGEESVRVLDTRKSAGVYYHIVDGVLSSSTGKVTAMVDAGRRSQIRKHHTATHLMHAALRERLGNHVEQRGSLVAPDRLRFDFSHFEKVDAESLTVVADQVNELIQRNVTGQIEEGVPIEEARDRGAMMLFGEKYGDIVRVVTFDPEISVELCGGTHVDASGEIGVFQFVSEGSIASGIRRVEAVVGRAALDLVRADREELHDVRSQFKSLEQPVGLEVAGVVAETKRLKKELESFKEQSLLGEIRTFVENATTIGDVTLAVGRFENVGMDTLLALGERLRELLGNGSVGLIGSSDEASGKAYLVATVSDDLIAESGVKAGTLVGQVAQLIGGGGGGRPTLASAGGRSPEKLESAMAEVPNILSQMLNP
jgi:alanyl-tRNA synthetase